MRFTSAILALAAVAQAASGVPAITETAADKYKVDTVFANDINIQFTPSAAGDNHAAEGDTFKITLPVGVEIKDGDQTVTTDYVLKCFTTTDGEKTMTDAMYTVAYKASDRIITLTKKGTTAKTFCITGGAVKLQLLKAGIFVKDIAAAGLKVANSKVAAEATTPVVGTADLVYSANTAGTLSGLVAPSTAKATGKFEIKFTPSAVSAATKFLMVYLPGYTVAATPKCKIGTTDVATISGGVYDSRFGWIKITGATSLWAAAASTLTCETGVTAGAAQAATKVTVVIGETTNPLDVSQLDLPKVITAAPTLAPTKAPTKAPFSAAPLSAAATGAAGFVSAVVAYFLF